MAATPAADVASRVLALPMKILQRPMVLVAVVPPLILLLLPPPHLMGMLGALGALAPMLVAELHSASGEHGHHYGPRHNPAPEGPAASDHPHPCFSRRQPCARPADEATAEADGAGRCGAPPHPPAPPPPHLMGMLGALGALAPMLVAHSTPGAAPGQPGHAAEALQRAILESLRA
jgi:hypothetical protein